MNAPDETLEKPVAGVQGKSLREMLLDSLRLSAGAISLSSKEIVTLISQHLACRRSERLPILVVEAAYEAVEARRHASQPPMKVYIVPDKHTDDQPGIQVSLVNGEGVLAVVEMTTKPVTRDHLENSAVRIVRVHPRIDKYLFVATGFIEKDVRKCTAALYEQTGGTEVAVVDCLGFLRYFFRLFPRRRSAFINAYQALVLRESDGAVCAALKDVFLSLRQAAEWGASE